MGQPYGWGGYLFNRDCSLAMRDLFVPFGVWLPRNSSAQAKAWQFISFVKASPSGKESIIKDEGVPFATLLWLRGHITLYIGEYKGEPVMFHNVWGVRTVEGNDNNARFVVGRAVVTSITPGDELKNLYRGTTFVDRLRTEAGGPETIARVQKLVFRSEYKRRQAPPMLRVRPRAFGTGRQMPIAAHYE